MDAAESPARAAAEEAHAANVLFCPPRRTPRNGFNGPLPTSGLPPLVGQAAGDSPTGSEMTTGGGPKHSQTHNHIFTNLRLGCSVRQHLSQTPSRKSLVFVRRERNL